MNSVLAEWNAAEKRDALDAMMACCGARRWAEIMVGLRPIESIATLSTEADRAWDAMRGTDWLEAFACHPRIGERKVAHSNAQSAMWSRGEQSSLAVAHERVLAELTELNALYEQRFGFTYVVCATGKSAVEMLSILKRRLMGDREVEMREAAEQQRQIMQIRLGKWLTS